MDIKLFEELGLSVNEAKIYQALIIYGGSGVSTISLRSKIHRSNAYDSLHRLIEKGLVYEVFGQRETVYEAVDPSKFLELLNEQSLKLKSALPGLLLAFQKHISPERAYIYKGIEGVKNYMHLALKSGQDIYTLGGKGAWLDPRLKTFTEWFMKEAKKKKMKLYNLFDAEVKKDLPKLPNLLSSEYKFLPKRHSTSAGIDIFGDHVVTFTGTNIEQMADDLTIFVIVSKELAEAYRGWWKLIWSLLP